MNGTGPVGIGIIGAGVISETYLENLSGFPDTRVLAIGDVRPDAARAKAAEHGVAASGDVNAVLDHPGVEIVVNLTIPAAHAEVAERALAAGKHVWNRPHRADGALAFHVLDVMLSIGEAATAGAFVSVASRPSEAPLLPPDWDPLASTTGASLFGASR